MIVEEVLKQNLKGEKWLFSPNIPSNKLNGACSVFDGLEPNKIIALFDNTLLGSGKAGFVLTGAKLYYKSFISGSDKFDIEYSNISSIKLEESSDKTNYISIQTKDNNTLNTYEEDIVSFDYNNFISVITSLISEGILFKEESQSVPLENEDTSVKTNFLKILINLLSNEEGNLDAKSYASIIQLISRLNFSKEERIATREYMLGESDIKTNDELLSEIKEKMPENRLHELHISLIKESINAFRAKNNINPYVAGTYKQDENISELKNKLNISDDEISLIEESIINDDKIFHDRDASDDKIKELFTDMAGKAAAVGVPLAAVYLTGTVGFSAAGLTSGLAALGMGGVLGFSSMVTGIGVALVIGVVSYKLVGKGIRAITGDDSEKYKQREFLLQNVMKQSQRAFNLLIEDINYLTSKAAELLKNNDVKQEVITNLYKKINVLASSQTAIMDNSDYAEKEKIIIHLPKYLDVNRLNTLTSDATLKEFRDFIINFYEEKEIETEQGNKNVFVLDESNELEDLEELLNCLNDIGYNDIKNIAAKSIGQGIENLGKNITSNETVAKAMESITNNETVAKTMDAVGKGFMKGFGSLKDKFGKK